MPIPGSPLTTSQRARPPREAVERRVDRRQLLAASDEPLLLRLRYRRHFRRDPNRPLAAVNSVPTAPSGTPTDLLTRGVAGFLVLILIDAAQLLAFYPDRTDTLWAWTIQPPLTAMLLGSVYVAGAYFFARVLFGAPWERVAAGFPPIIAFVWMAAIATALHLDRFHEDSLPFAAWAALYVVTPIGVPLLYLHNRRPIGGPPLPRAMRIGARRGRRRDRVASLADPLRGAGRRRSTTGRTR